MQSEELQPVSGVPVVSTWRAAFLQSGKRPFIKNLHYQRAGKTISKDKLYFKVSRVHSAHFVVRKNMCDHCSAILADDSSVAGAGWLLAYHGLFFHASLLLLIICTSYMKNTCFL